MANRIKSKRVFVGKHLSKSQAMRVKRPRGDFRGFNYNPKTGWAVWT